MKVITANTLLSKNYPVYGFDGEWLESLGDVEKHFRMLLYGPSGSGKTRFSMKFALYCTKFGKVYYNSLEQGEGKGLQDVVKWAEPTERQAQLLTIGDRETYEQMCERLDRDRHIKFVVIDSLDYMNLTQSQYKAMIERFPRKSFIIICWCKGKEPRSQHAKAIEYMVDIKSYCEAGRVFSKSRYAVGTPKPFRIFHTEAKGQQQLFEQ